MQTTPCVEALLADLAAMATLGDEAVADDGSDGSSSTKTSVEAAAAREGVSVNTWIVRALNRAASAPTTVRRSGRRLTGYAES